MINQETLFFDRIKERVKLIENFNYVQSKVIANEEYTLSGSLYFNKKETEKKILLVVSFNNMILSKEESLKCGFSYSEKYGTFKYLTANINDQFSFRFSIPLGIDSIRIGIRKWHNKYDTFISSKLTLTGVQAPAVIDLIDFEEMLRKSEEHLFSKLGSVIHMYFRAKKSDYLVLTNNYPSYGNYYQNAFIHARVRAYIKNGIHPDVYKIISEETLEHYRFEEVHVTIGSGKTFDDLLVFHNYKKVLVHFLNENMWEYLKKYIDYTKIFVWVHGYEIQPWHRRAFNYETEEELEKAKHISKKRMKFWQTLLKDPHSNLKLIFASQHFANEVMADLDIVLPKSSYEIIHNYINTDLFTYEEKQNDQRKKILSIRPYASKKYANDLSVQAVLYLEKKYPEIFTDLEFTFIGDGVLFESTLAPIKELDNVTIERTFLSQKDIAKLHKKYGVFLCPTRMDSQGVSRDEAMSSGLVPITNHVAAIPEFVDERCGILAEEEDYIGLAEGIINLYKNPDLFLEMSENSAQRVRLQSNYDQTILRELDMIRNKIEEKGE